MLYSNAVCNPIVPDCRLSKNENRNTVDETYFKQLVGSLMYLTTIRPDMMFITCLISRYMAKPLDIHLQAAKRALRYLKGTIIMEFIIRQQEMVSWWDSQTVTMQEI